MTGAVPDLTYVTYELVCDGCGTAASSRHAAGFTVESSDNPTIALV
jgi:hypothetical protein